MRTTLSYKQFGDPRGEEIIVCLAGFPDNEVTGWGDVLEHLRRTKPGFRIICMCLPDFEDEPLKETRRPWGYSWDEITTLLHATIEDCVPRDKQFTLMIHDWGAYGGFMYENRHPDRVKQIICFDVAMGISKGKSIFPPMLIVTLYQLWWALAYFVSQAIAKVLVS